ncbi:hypothetical protein LJB42_003493 [Komagataella kurtzmanii]|nr:hypothetical protein LJB42_003493 [Komagataella kurtzmanii]
MVLGPVVIPALKGPAKGAMIIVHGLGDSGEGWRFFGELFGRYFPDVTTILPNAPEMPVTVNGGYVMRSWFDIYEFGNPKAKQDADGILKSARVLQDLVKEQVSKGIDPSKIVLGGFSQGASISLIAASTLDIKIGGVIAMSGFISIPKEVTPLITSANKSTPFFQGHGTADPVIQFTYGEQCRDFFKSHGFTNYQLHSYEGMQHSTSDEELRHIYQFLSKAYS